MRTHQNAAADLGKQNHRAHASDFISPAATGSNIIISFARLRRFSISMYFWFRYTTIRGWLTLLILYDEIKIH